MTVKDLKEAIDRYIAARECSEHDEVVVNTYDHHRGKTGPDQSFAGRTNEPDGTPVFTIAVDRLADFKADDVE